LPGQAKLPEARNAGSLPGFLFRPGHDRQPQGREHGNNANDDEQFDQGEDPLFLLARIAIQHSLRFAKILFAGMASGINLLV
jgi:hypothetical protein